MAADLSAASRQTSCEQFFVGDVGDNPEKIADLKTKISLGHISQPQKIACIFRMLVSDIVSHFGGTALTVDGEVSAYSSFARSR